MRKILIAIIAVAVMGAVITQVIRPYERSVPEAFKDGMYFVDWQVYADPNAGYSFRYPSFLEKERDDGKGNVTFGYHSHGINIVMEMRVDSVVDFEAHGNDIIRTGQVPDIDGYGFFSHYVRHDGRWYALTLLYPYSCKDGAAEIMRVIKWWRPFERKRNFTTM